MFSSIARAAGALVLTVAALPAAACGKSEAAAVIRLKVSSPLTVLQHGPATDIAIDAAGCVTTRFPAIDKRHGTHRFQMPGDEFAALKREIRAARLLEFDAERIQATLEGPRPKALGRTEHFAADADLVEIELAPGIADAKAARAASIRWSGVEASLMNRPDIAELQSLAAVKSRLLEVAGDPRAQKEPAR